jgi:predicted nuclease of predicted toxin-antitoxin system
MNLSPDWVPVLQGAGFEAIHWSAIGDPRAKDETILSWAKTRGHIVFTHDLDFGTILASSKMECPSVLQIRTQDVNPSHLGDLVISVFRQFQEQLRSGALISVDEQNARARLLPIAR